MATKSLYVSNNMEGLKERAILPDLRNKKFIQLLNAATTLIREAKRNQLLGDEELAYICFMKFFNLIIEMRKRKDYTQNKQMMREKLGDQQLISQYMNLLESLGNSLSKRYENNEDSMHAKTLGKQSQQYAVLNQYENNKSEIESSISTLNSITCYQLFEQMKYKKTLIIDCRSADDFDFSHLHYKWAFNVPAEYIQAGMSAGKLQDKLNAESKALWSARSVKDLVVLMDWNCNSTNPSSNSTIGILLDILKNWDPDVTYRSPIKILQNGYQHFIMLYPTECTNPIVKPPQTNNHNLDIDDIEYPSINDITMKDEIRENSYQMLNNNHNNNNNNENESIFDRLRAKAATRATSAYVKPPSIDRSSKFHAIRKIEENDKHSIMDILKEQEELIMKSKATDAKLMEISETFENINDKTVLTDRDQQIRYSLMQLENEANDYRIENERLRSELDKYKLEAAQRETVEMEPKLIDARIQELEHLQEQQEHQHQLRQQQLKVINQQPSGEFRSNRSRPTFDRSIKPKLESPNDAHIEASLMERQRDFSPVPGAVGPGLTGLKNLGNTCYMNSILQCLSNTPQLTEYCTSDKYKQYISRSNKTKGHIVEEVAALIKALWNGSYRCIASKDLRYVIGQYQQMFNGYDQQDSHEFLTILMDWLHSDLQTLNISPNPHSNITASEKAWLEFTNSKESLILHLFYGQIKSTVKCAQCDNESATYESFSNLSLELPSNANTCTLVNCLDMYFSGERINGWNCPNCKQKRDAVKKLNVSKLPPVLVIHLKRFYATTEGSCQTYKKKQTYVRFPLDNLDMTPYIAKSESRSLTPKSYELYGLSNHYGTMQSGHYTAFCKSGHYERWFKYDDIAVTLLEPSKVISSAAYILFYTWLPHIPYTNI